RPVSRRAPPVKSEPSGVILDREINQRPVLATDAAAHEERRLLPTSLPPHAEDLRAGDARLLHLLDLQEIGQSRFDVIATGQRAKEPAARLVLGVRPPDDVRI